MFMEGVTNVSNCLSLLVYFSIPSFFHEIRDLPEAHIDTDTAGEIRGDLHE